MELLYSIAFLLIGALIGFGFAQSKKDDPVGTLHIESSDSDGLYMFLEIYRGKTEVIKKSKNIVLKVDTNSYLSQE